jgi:hypothetical protein
MGVPNALCIGSKTMNTQGHVQRLGWDDHPLGEFFWRKTKLKSSFGT